MGVCSALAKMESLISSGGWLDGKKSNDVSSYFPRPRNISFRISALSKGIFLRRGKENVFAKRISFTVVDWTDPAPTFITLLQSLFVPVFASGALESQFRTEPDCTAETAASLEAAAIKIHQDHHIIMSYLPKKPKSFGNYLDEDFVRLVKTRAATCHPKSLGKTVLWKCSLSMCIRWGVLKL